MERLVVEIAPLAPSLVVAFPAVTAKFAFGNMPGKVVNTIADEFPPFNDRAIYDHELGTIYSSLEYALAGGKHHGWI